MALLRVKGVLAGLAILEMVEALRRAERAVEQRNSVVDILVFFPVAAENWGMTAMYQLVGVVDRGSADGSDATAG